ncbi:hypothetical protein GDO86_001056 [Hymenochirus boettgeri]|uniref:Beta-1,4-galactosyltransferase n=1 Tax=Hymenochirus boettgeri TaxID=247094 RepID=A0A8T2KDD1_9PIPI|nr:hypothetical protein GDO86_001056 [Hymenochirus boettgeri]
MQSYFKILFLLMTAMFFFTFTYFWLRSSVTQDFEQLKLLPKVQPKLDFIKYKEELWQKLRKSGKMFVPSNTSGEIPDCPEIPPDLSPLNVHYIPNITYIKIVSQNPNVGPGGHGKPEGCKARQKVALIIPFRDRDSHLRNWLYYMHPFLKAQQADYGIYVVEQSEGSMFNRAKLMNVGYVLASNDYDYNCFIFTDVDIIPMDQRNLYRCSSNPKHMANALDKFNFILPYPNLFGGIVAFTKEQFTKVNGFSNMFWGWGGEDDELYQRVVAVGMKVERPDLIIARARMISHNRDAGNEETGKSVHLIFKASQRMYKDGLNTLNYTIIGITGHKLFTKITVDVGTEQSNPVPPA